MNVETFIKGNESQNELAPASSLQNQTDRTHQQIDSLLEKLRYSSPKKKISENFERRWNHILSPLPLARGGGEDHRFKYCVSVHTDTLQVNTRYSKQLNTWKKS